MRQEIYKSRKELSQRWRGELFAPELNQLNDQIFVRYDAWLDRCVKDSPRWLSQDTVARIVMEEMHHLDGDRYHLHAYCIMPNHVHFMIDNCEFYTVNPTNLAGASRNYPLTDMLRLLKGRTARFCNQVLGRSGSFWHHESYDHVVRNNEEYQRVVEYIIQNPVKAQLIAAWQEWPYSYLAR